MIGEGSAQAPPEWVPQQGTVAGVEALLSIAPRLRAVILLAGSVRESALSRALGRSILDLPLDRGRTVLGAWAQQAAGLAQAGGISTLPLRVVFNRTSVPPAAIPKPPDLRLSMEFDREELRGTGGLLRDLADEYQPDDLLLVANAHQVVIPPLAGLANSLAAAMGDVALLATTNHTPCGIKLFRCKALAAIKSRGFIDLKEQALPAIAAAHEVRVVATQPGLVFPVRTLEGYLGALRALHTQPGFQPNALAEDCFPTFSLVESGASVAPTARVHDSVVLKAATVGADAVLIRSLVCEGGAVPAGEVVADRVIGAAPARPAERPR